MALETKVAIISEKTKGMPRITRELTKEKLGSGISDEGVGYNEHLKQLMDRCGPVKS
jgi:hypothetical protein